MHRSVPYSCLLLITLLVACSTQPARVPPHPAEAPVTGAAAGLGQSAEQQRVSGRLDDAAVLYERALRIEPYNGRLWYGLARVRLDQQDWRQAIALASKSNTLARSDRALMADNWRLIGDARRGLGDQPAANEAYGRAEALQPGGRRRTVQ